MNEFKFQKLLIVLLQQKKTSTIIVLSISGLMTLLFFTDFEPSTPNTSEMTNTGISDTLKNGIFELGQLVWSEDKQNDKVSLSSCSIANVLIGKNLIAKCEP